MMRSILTRYVAAAGIMIATTASALAADKVIFMLDWLPAGDKAAPYVAQAKGLFAAEGLDVTILSGRGSSDVVTKLATGAGDMGTGGLAALLQARAESNVPVKAVASVYTMQPDAIFTTDSSGINSLKDIAGKKIATATFSSSNVVWPLLLKANGIDPGKVELLRSIQARWRRCWQQARLTARSTGSQLLRHSKVRCTRSTRNSRSSHGQTMVLMAMGCRCLLGKVSGRASGRSPKDIEGFDGSQQDGDRRPCHRWRAVKEFAQ